MSPPPSSLQKEEWHPFQSLPVSQPHALQHASCSSLHLLSVCYSLFQVQRPGQHTVLMHGCDSGEKKWTIYLTLMILPDYGQYFQLRAVFHRLCNLLPHIKPVISETSL